MILLLIFICNGKFFIFVYTLVVIDVSHFNFVTGTAAMLFCRIVKRYEPSDLPIHIFSTHFYTALHDSGSSAVSRWTSKKNLDVFKKRFLLIPVHGRNHWSLIVVINAQDIAKERRGTAGGAFGVVHLDSLMMHSSRKIFGHVMKWLRSEYRRLRPLSSEFPPKKYKDICSSPRSENMNS